MDGSIRISSICKGVCKPEYWNFASTTTSQGTLYLAQLVIKHRDTLGVVSVLGNSVGYFFQYSCLFFSIGRNSKNMEGIGVRYRISYRDPEILVYSFFSSLDTEGISAHLVSKKLFCHTFILLVPV